MITVSDVSVRVGARLLLDHVDFRVSPGDKIGLVGRNGAGKTTLATVLSGAAAPASGAVERTGSVGYLRQDSHPAGCGGTAAERILSTRGMDEAVRDIRAAEAAMAEADGAALAKAMNAYARAEDRFLARGGYAAEADAAQLAAHLGLGEDVLEQRLDALSGGQRRRVELARLLFAGHDTLLLDEPTNHLDADSVVWLRRFLLDHAGGFVLISHDVALLEATVNRVFHLDAQRSTIDVYNVGWATYRAQLETDARRRRRERLNAQRKAESLRAQAAKMQSNVKTAVSAKNMVRRAERMLAEAEPERRDDKVARLRLPDPPPCGRTPLTADRVSKGYGSHEVFTGVDVAVDRGARMAILGLNGAGKTTLLRILAGRVHPDSGRVRHGAGARVGYYAQEHETLDGERTVLENLTAAAPHLEHGEARMVLGSFLFSGDDAGKPARVLSGGEKTRLALAALVCSRSNVLLLDEPTNNLDPASRAEILRAIATYRGSIVLVTHDDGAVEALRPERVLLLPDGTEDLWHDEYRDLVSLA
ncbi:ABC-F family ATP-binding cassette domain-containing protein [Saccharopolyspora sp. NFXS83]|uniref:ABC-F family ATP-binding cassette domain-containing protein n=1 Tax=Saccharopolyspora sp. NFXS83 TaxID=2993560 RepID=UPI00224A9A3F|nr:ABC-F family ATP-binding cassette domain-containing protein [Saccharopolyspora sp. NFXS83]MCX2730642.1 ABC-F family ATP-binding cassette domain-containing protein [Saccharopolyspora sp. NFXS83]